MTEHQTQLPTTHKTFTDFSTPVLDIGAVRNSHDPFSLDKAWHFCAPPLSDVRYHFTVPQFGLRNIVDGRLFYL